MPMKRCDVDGKPGFKWGDAGKCYTYTPGDAASIRAARKRCLQQAAAMGDMDAKRAMESMSKSEMNAE